MLESFHEAFDLYLSRDSEVSICRPLFTGDVFRVEANSAWMVAAHPCTMRGKGAKLLPTTLVVPVSEMQQPPRIDKWADGFFRYMPLPDLLGSFRVAEFDGMTRIDTAALVITQRVACLSQFGINLFQQRMVFHLTRLEVTTTSLGAAFAHTFAEAELLEEWVEEAVARGGTIEAASALFEEAIRAPFSKDNVATLQDALREPQHRATIRQRLRKLARGSG